MSEALYHIDHNKHFHLELNYNQETGTVDVRLPINPLYTGRFEKNLANEILNVKIGEDLHTLTNDVDAFSLTTQIPTDEETNLQIMMRDQTFAEFRLGADGNITKTGEQSQLIDIETVEIGRYPSDHLPYNRKDVEPPTYLPTIDVHTHSSAFYSPADVIAEALKFEDPPYAYPTRLLKELGVEYGQDNLTEVKRVFFPPLAHLDPIPFPETDEAVYLKDLTPEALKKLEVSMEFPPDRQETYGYMESPIYQMRYPFTKDDRLFAPLIRKGAQRMAEMGYVYTEISMVSEIFNPERLEMLHKIAPEIEEEFGIKLRFLASLPRNLPHEQLHDMVEKLKILAESPYIVGCDVLGYETNKTADIAPHLENIAKWAAKNQPEFIMRVHAGENAKNLDNIKEAVSIALEHGIRIRIGHGLHGLDGETQNLIVEHREENQMIGSETQFSSAMHNNNANRIFDFTNMRKLRREGVPQTLGTDGMGIYGTTPLQMAWAARFAGATDEFFGNVQKTEEDLIARQQKEFYRKQDIFPADFFENVKDRFPPATYTGEVRKKYADDKNADIKALKAELSASGIVHTRKEIDDDLEGKTPILISGAAGKTSNWKKLPLEQKQEIQIAMQMLPRVMDPEKVYFASGRTKSEGIGVEICKAVQKFNNTTDGKQFAMLGMLAEPTKLDVNNMKLFTHAMLGTNTLITMCRDLINYIKEKSGLTVFAGGGAFTADQIVISDNSNTNMGLMADINGASKQKSKCMDPKHSFTGAKGMIKHLHAQDPKLFREDFDIEKDLDTIHNRAERCVAPTDRSPHP